MARDASVCHVGFQAITALQRSVGDELCKRGFHPEGSWGFVKALTFYSQTANGYSLVAQFRHDGGNSLRLWLQNKAERNNPECVADREVPVGDFCAEWLVATERLLCAAFGA
jgi:hypothetical protein